jgi:hypothetical protein
LKAKALLIAALVGFCLLAADRIQPLSAKLGLWEVTTTQQMSGVPPIPADRLAKLTPEQRAHMEALFKQKAGSPTVRTRQTCVTQEKLDKAPFSEERANCQRTVVNSTSKMLEMHEVCTEQDGSQRQIDAKYEIVGDNSMKGSTQVKASNAGRTMNMNIDLSGKWLGSDCGAIKD